MGLDFVELVMRIEETFGIEIADRVDSTLYTPRDVIDFVLTQVEVSEAPHFLHRHPAALYRVAEDNRITSR
jgi:hypothetical protein